jgi:hypothetical protein
LKTLKASGFLGQNSEGLYHLDATQERHIANKAGITSCRYHPDALNVDWCPFCGNPVCGRCLSSLPNGFIACQECKHEKMNSLNKLHYWGYFVGSFLITCFFLTLKSNMFMTILLIILLIYVMVKESNWIKNLIKDRKEFFAWKRMANDHPISDETIQSIIQEQEMNSCRYHVDSIAINQCEICESNICPRCSRILREFYSERLVCFKCFWKRRKRVLKFFVGSYLIMLIFYFVGITLIIAISPVIKKNVVFFFIFSFGFMPGLLIGVPLLILSLYWIKCRQRYEIWSNEQIMYHIK